MAQHLSGKVCVVTGASGGLGRAIALGLAAAGATVCAVARRQEELSGVVEAMGGRAGGHVAVRADVSVSEDVAAMARAVRDLYGRCDVLVNNAGIAGEGRFEDGGPPALQRVMATNFCGAVHCTAALLPLLFESVPSHVINMASVAGRFGLGGASAYCASKFALVGWSESLRYELRPRGVNVCVIEPGPIPTPGFPQTALVRNPLLRLALASQDDVVRAVMDALAKGKAERFVPRWYYLLQFPRLAAPPLFRALQERVLRSAG